MLNNTQKLACTFTSFSVLSRNWQPMPQAPQSNLAGVEKQ